MSKIIQWVLIAFFVSATLFGVGLVWWKRANADSIGARSTPPTPPPAAPPAAAPDPTLARIDSALQAILAKLDQNKGTPVKGGGDTDPFRDYAKAYTTAVATGKPLVIWSCYYCGSSAAQLTGMVHVRADRFNGDPTPRVIVGVPDGHGGFATQRESVLAADVCATSLRAALSPPAPPQQAGTWATAQAAAPMIGGGFGGGGG